MELTMEITTRIGCKNNCAYCPQAKLIKAYQKRGGDLIMSLENFAVLKQSFKQIRMERNCKPGFIRMNGLKAGNIK